MFDTDIDIAAGVAAYNKRAEEKAARNAAEDTEPERFEFSDWTAVGVIVFFAGVALWAAVRIWS